MKWFPLLILTLAFVAGANNHLNATPKTGRVMEYLGAYRYEYDKPLGTVKFIFQQAVLTREGDGKKSYKLLLISQRGFTNNDNAGDLLAIQVVHKGKTMTIYPEPKTKGKGKNSKVAAGEEAVPMAPAPLVKKSKKSAAAQPVPVEMINEPPAPQRAVEIGPTPSGNSSVSTDPIRPRPLFDNQSSNGAKGSISLPDSATIAKNLDNAKQSVTGWKGKLWKSAQPVWEFVMWIFNSIIVLLICFGGLCRYVAKTAAAESRITRKGRVVVGRWIVGAHQNASAMLLVITWIIAVVFLIDVFMWLIYLDLPVWLLVVIWFPVLWFAEKLTSWIVPNIRGDESTVN